MNRLKLSKSIFTLDKDNSRLEYTIEENKIVSCNLEINFLEGQYNNEAISPTIFINDIELDKKKVKELKGVLLKTNTPEESDEREDYIQLFECEPFEELTIEVLDIDEYSANIKLTGIAITNGYTEPYEKENFELEIRIKVKKSENKQEAVKVDPVKESKAVKNMVIISLAIIAFGLFGVAAKEKVAGYIIIGMGIIILLMAIISSKTKQ